jgi:hypothetical protein
MVRLTRSLSAVIAVATVASGLFLQRVHGATPAPAQKVGACSLLTVDEVKKFAHWAPHLDQLKPQEESLANGSACNYPTVYIQVMSMTPDRWKGWVNGLKNPTLEPVPNVGDEAYIRDNNRLFTEFCARAGTNVLTVQYSLNDVKGETTQAVKPRIIELGKALVAKLR